MALKDWKLRYPKRLATTGIYRNKKTGEHIQVGGKQLVTSNNFTDERYPFYVEVPGYSVNVIKDFKEKKDAMKYFKQYMRTH